MKIKLNKYINIVRPAPRGRRADPEGVRDPSLMGGGPNPFLRRSPYIYILIKSNIYIYIGIVILLYRNMLNYNIISIFIINFLYIYYIIILIYIIKIIFIIKIFILLSGFRLPWPGPGIIN